MLCCVVLFLSTSAYAQSDELLRAVELVENRQGDPDLVGDNGDALGILQIHKVMVDDVNRIVGYKKFTYEDRRSPKKSREMFRIYCKHYSKGASDEVIARRWNGGPTGDKKSATKEYWRKVRRELK
jgi:hypothetical protein